ncbi:hypothetical protein PENSTE_c017G09060 [Penicillium steckii]|uniref:Uncharacterized protein n=1 Tax=Penicillium steckii TaxID=303698 RepID=A0A1V6SY45_9EURO|nr:hypothetical protein PENSTE_c017G09060 [Penicillium steckii]
MDFYVKGTLIWDYLRIGRTLDGLTEKNPIFSIGFLFVTSGTTAMLTSLSTTKTIAGIDGKSRLQDLIHHCLLKWWEGSV